MLLLICLFWEVGVLVGWLDPFFTSQPTAIATELVEQIATGELTENLAVSLGEFVVGFGSAIALGILLGMLAGWYRTLEYALDPFIWFFYAAPLVAFYPLFVLWLGLGPRTVAAISFLLALPPIMTNTLSGMKHVDPTLVRAARSLGAGKGDLFLKVALPASVPMVMAGLRLGVGRALTGVVIAELFGATAGLGFSISYYGSLLRTTEMMTSLVVIVGLGVLFHQGLSMLEGRFDSWRSGPGA
ncbi:MAG TPA: ABC transporter permease [Vicinamibacteria bacterium]|nr:ABC transporter permease [Vicinamibacteria bacterium]